MLYFVLFAKFYMFRAIVITNRRRMKFIVYVELFQSDVNVILKNDKYDAKSCLTARIQGLDQKSIRLAKAKQEYIKNDISKQYNIYL